MFFVASLHGLYCCARDHSGFSGTITWQIR
jgi:hypothetical protein